MEESIDLYKKVLEEFRIKKQHPDTYSSLVLAYLGDAVFEVVIRSMIVAGGNEQVNHFHKKCSSLVNASTQARMIEYLMEDLTEEEEKVFRRGRNAKSYTSAKNASVRDYRMATGFEALMGYLFMEGRTERIFELIKKALQEEEKGVS